MARLNPKNLTWQAPTQNEDGTPITGSLNYELGIKMQGDAAAEPFDPYVSVVGALTEKPGIFNAPVADFGLPHGKYQFALRAANADEPELFSGWSNSIEVDLLAIPRPPILQED